MARPRKPLIDRDEAVRTALAMIDKEGLPAFSLEALSRRLGVKGPSLYHHFEDRADLLARVAQLILLEVPDLWGSAEDVLSWDERMLRMTVELRHAMLRHPNAAPILVEHFPRELVLAAYEHAVVALESAGVPDRLHLLIFEGMEKLALGSALSHAAAGGRGKRPFPAFDRRELPALDRAVKASDHDADSLFEACCVTFLDGVKAMVGAAR